MFGMVRKGDDVSGFWGSLIVLLLRCCATQASIAFASDGRGTEQKLVRMDYKLETEPKLLIVRKMRMVWTFGAIGTVGMAAGNVWTVGTAKTISVAMLISLFG